MFASSSASQIAPLNSTEVIPGLTIPYEVVEVALKPAEGSVLTNP
ncbi:4'-phosphopantetheinyl transferase, partial [Listeria ivanovii FSL F6-596]